MFFGCWRVDFTSKNLHTRGYKYIIIQSLKRSRHFEAALLVGEGAPATPAPCSAAWRAQYEGWEEPGDFMMEAAEENISFILSCKFTQFSA